MKALFPRTLFSWLPEFTVQVMQWYFIPIILERRVHFSQLLGYCREYFAESHNSSLFSHKKMLIKKSNSFSIFRLALSHPDFLIISLHKTIQSKDESIRTETCNWHWDFNCCDWRIFIGLFVYCVQIYSNKKSENDKFYDKLYISAGHTSPLESVTAWMGRISGEEVNLRTL